MRVVVLSLAVHAAAFAVVMRMPRRARAPEAAPPVPIEVVEDEPPLPPPIETVARSEGGGASVAARGVPARGGVRIASVETSREEGPAEGTSETSPAPAPTWSGSFYSLGPKEIGIGRDNPLLVSSAAPSEEKKKPSYGLGFRPSSEGPALTALRDVTSRSLAPLNGRARFTVRVDADGKVLGIDLDDATGGPGWDDARRLALEEMKERKIFVPQGARGLNVRFEIVSELSYPTGQKSPGEFSFVPGAIVLPDESNIGQKPTRKIHARHLGTEVL